MAKHKNMVSQAQRKFEGYLEGNMGKCVIYLEGIAKKKVSRGNITGEFPSAPGEPPRVVTGQLRATIAGFTERAGHMIRGFLGAFTPYARRLEFGFVGIDSRGRKYNQAPRPFLRPTLAEEKLAIVKILATGRR